MPARVQRLLQSTARAGRRLVESASVELCHVAFDIPGVQILAFGSATGDLERNDARFRVMMRDTLCVERGLRLGRWRPRCAAASCGCRGGSTGSDDARQHSTRRDQHRGRTVRSRAPATRRQ